MAEEHVVTFAPGKRVGRIGIEWRCTCGKGGYEWSERMADSAWRRHRGAAQGWQIRRARERAAGRMAEAIVRICDRCGAKSEPGERLDYFGWRMAHHSLNMAVNPATLCPKCSASFDSWWLQPQRRWGSGAALGGEDSTPK